MTDIDTGNVRVHALALPSAARLGQGFEEVVDTRR